jgi:DNA-binding transcriptional MerR regulator
MVRQPARPLRKSGQKREKSKNSAIPSGASVRPLKIGEAAKLLGVEAYVLRFWETQFPDLRPHHTETKHRLYSPQDIEILRLIKHLLYDEGFTIEGARKRIKEFAHAEGHAKAATVNSSGGKSAPAHAPASHQLNQAPGARRALIEIRRDLESLYQLLKD